MPRIKAKSYTGEKTFDLSQGEIHHLQAAAVAPATGLFPGSTEIIRVHELGSTAVLPSSAVLKEGRTYFLVPKLGSRPAAPYASLVLADSFFA